MLWNCGVREDSWESLGLQGDPTSPFWRRSTLGFLWKEWCWSWNSSILATSCEELTHWKRLWCWEGLGAGGERDDRGWDGWMASRTRRSWVWVNSGRWWWTGRPGVLRFTGSQRVGHNWATELNWTDGPVVKTPCVHCRGNGFKSLFMEIGNKIPQVTQCNQNKNVSQLLKDERKETKTQMLIHQCSLQHYSQQSRDLQLYLAFLSLFPYTKNEASKQWLEFTKDQMTWH